MNGSSLGSRRRRKREERRCVYVCVCVCVCVIFLQLAPDRGSDASKQGFCCRSFLENVEVCVDITAGWPVMVGCGDRCLLYRLILFSRRSFKAVGGT